MLRAIRLFALALLVIATGAGAADIKPFVREDMASDAVRLTETLRIATAAIGAQVKGKAPDQLRKEAAAASAAANFDAAEKLCGRGDHGRSQGPRKLARLRRRRDQGRRRQGERPL